MKNTVFLFVIVTFLLSITYSCKKSDTAAPDFTLSTPSSGDKYAIGEDILLNGTFTDNKALSNCVASLSYNGSGSDPWTPQGWTISLSGTSQTITDEQLFGTSIPDKSLGSYTLKFDVSDDAGNVTSKSVNIEIVSNTPTINVTEPVEGQTYVFYAEFNLKATFTDNKELKECVATMVRTGDVPGKASLKGATGIDDPWDPDPYVIDLTGTSDSYNGPLFGGMVPECQIGTYKLTLEVKDTAGNSASVDVNVVITSGD